MILNGLKNFAKNLKYIVVPVGVITLFFLFALSIAVPSSFKALQTMVNDVVKVANTVELNFQAFFQSFTEEIGKIDWSSPESVWQTVSANGWLANAIKNAFSKLVDQEVINQITQIINSCIKKIAMWGIFTVIMLVIGIVVGYWVTRFSIRRVEARNTIKKTILYGALDMLVTMSLIAIMIVLFRVWAPTIFFVPLLIIIALQLWQIIEAYLEYGKGKVPFKKVFNAKNTLLSLATNMIIVAITVLLIFLLSFIFGNIFLLVLMVAIFEVMMATNSVNVCSYIKKYVEDNQQLEVQENQA